MRNFDVAIHALLFVVGSCICNVSYAQRLVERLTLQVDRCPVNAIALSKSGKLLASGSGTVFTPGLVKIWDTNSGKELATLKGHQSRVSFLVFSQDDDVLISASWDGTIRIWDMKTKKCLDVLKDFQYKCIDCLIVDQKRKVLIAAGGTGDKEAKSEILMWSLATHNKIMHLNCDTEQIQSLAIDPKSDTLYSAGRDKIITIWTLSSGKIRRQLIGHTEWINKIELSPDRSVLASASSDEKIMLWNTKTNERLATLEGHTGYVTSLRFAPDGKWLVSGSGGPQIANEGTAEIIIWDIGSKSKLRSLKAHSHQITDIVISSTMKFLYTSSADHSIIQWAIKE